jgi:hypothetical protein
MKDIGLFCWGLVFTKIDNDKSSEVTFINSYNIHGIKCNQIDVVLFTDK